jgi:pimeloyl-ACP methyl ester carboxylesterase
MKAAKPRAGSSPSSSAASPDLPLILLGHSWGSFLAQMLLDEHPDAYDAVILSGRRCAGPAR